MPSTAKSRTPRPRCPNCDRAIRLNPRGAFMWHFRQGVAYNGKRYVRRSVPCGGSGLTP